MDDITRKEEISAVLSAIQMMCVSSKMTLMAKQVRGVLCVIVRDETDGKEYVITKTKESA